MAEIELAWVGLGSNLGDRQAHLGAATGCLAAIADGPLVVSPIYETEPWGVDDQPAFLNGVVGLRIEGSAQELLTRLQRIEGAAGRIRTGERWGPRPLDLDLLCWGSLVFDTDRLTLPHPRIAERRFVLAPWADIAGDIPVPGFDATVAELLARCPDPGDVRKLS